MTSSRSTRQQMCCIPAVCALLLSVCAANLFGQHPVDPAQRYHRLICLVHLTGSGKNGDPILPEYAPVPGSAASPTSAPTTTASAGTGNSSSTPGSSASAAVARPGILAWSSQPTDDGTMAIVHYVAADRNAFAAILADTRPEIKVFEIGKDSQATIEAFMRQYKKGFKLDSIRVMAQ